MKPRSQVAWRACSAAAVWAVVVCALLAAACGSLPAVTGDGPRQRALLVAVGGYPPGSGWETLSAETDLELVAGALRHHGFSRDAIRTLTGSAATRDGILRAIDEHLLGPARPGDVLVLLLSGHGQRLTDGPDGDELDGYDEAFVPWDAPRSAVGGYGGERHLRDDQLAEVVGRLRRKAGARGDVVVLLDSCFSGTGTRGDAVLRGGPPLGPPAAAARHDRPVADARGGGGGLDGVAEPQARATGRAPLAVFAAARSDQTAYETRTVDNRSVGPLSRAFARGLLTPGLDLTYRGLADEIRWQMASYALPHQPQAEGDLDRRLFAGRSVAPVPFLRIAALDDDRRSLSVRPGSLAGLEPGAQVEVHRPGTVEPTPRSRLAYGTVEHSSHSTATVRLTAPLTAERPNACRVFVTKHSYGDLRLRVRMVGRPRGEFRGRSLAGALEAVPALELVEDEPQLIVRWNEERRSAPSASTSFAGWTIYDAATGQLLAAQPPEGSGTTLADRLRSFARNRYLRRVDQFDPELAVPIEVVPVAVSGCSEPGVTSLSGCTVEPLSASPGGGLVELPLGSFFQLRVAPARQAVYLTVLDLMPDGQIEVLWPPRGVVEKLVPGPPRLLPSLYVAIEPTGLDQLIAIASREPLDFYPFRWVARAGESGDRGEGGRRLGPFEPLFDDLLVRTRSRRVVIDTGEVSTAAATMWVVAQPDAR